MPLKKSYNTQKVVKIEMGADESGVPLPEVSLPPDTGDKWEPIPSEGIFGCQYFAYHAMLESRESHGSQKRPETVEIDFMNATIMERQKNQIKEKVECLGKRGKQASLDAFAEKGREAAARRAEAMVAQDVNPEDDAKEMDEAKVKLTTVTLPRLAVQLERVDLITANRKRQMST